MPCYEVRAIQVEFKAQSIDILEKALQEARIGYYWNADNTEMIGPGWKINFENQTAQVGEAYAENLNRVRRAYSEAVIREVARKKKWLVKKKADGRLNLMKY